MTSLAKNAGDPKGPAAPKGAVQSRTDFGVPGYGGPCPPKGDAPHHYHFTIFAVDTPKLDGDENISAAVVGFHAPLPHARQSGAGRRYGAIDRSPGLLWSGETVQLTKSRARRLDWAARETVPLKERGPS